MAHSKKLRTLVVEAYKRGEGTYPELAKRYGVGDASVSRWLRADREEGRREARHGGGRTSKIDSEGRLIIKAIVDERNDRTQQEIADEYESRTGVKVSTSTVDRALKKLGYTRKKKSLVAEERDKPETKRARLLHVEWLRLLTLHNLVFLDEMGVNSKMTTIYGRSPRNARAYGSKPGGYAKNVSVVGALCEDGVLCMMALDGAFDADAFVVYVEQVLCPKLRPDTVVVMDNVRFHKDPRVIEAIEAVGCHVLFQPPYSPDLNPIEECWSKMKSFLRKAKARSREALDAALAAAAELVTPQDAAGWFQHSLVQA